MEWIDKLNQLPIVVGVLLIIVGFVMYRFPPKKINFFVGYRTPKSMDSQENWDFSQKYAASEMIKSGFALLPEAIMKTTSAPIISTSRITRKRNLFTCWVSLAITIYSNTRNGINIRINTKFITEKAENFNLRACNLNSFV